VPPATATITVTAAITTTITTIVTAAITTTTRLPHDFPLRWPPRRVLLWALLFEFLSLWEVGLAHSQFRVVKQELPPLGIAGGFIQYLLSQAPTKSQHLH
jgi:hypothetical protein